MIKYLLYKIEPAEDEVDTFLITNDIPLDNIDIINIVKCLKRFLGHWTEPMNTRDVENLYAKLNEFTKEN